MLTVWRGKVHGAPILDDRRKEHWECVMAILECACTVEPSDQDGPHDHTRGHCMHSTDRVEDSRVVVIPLHKREDVPRHETERRDTEEWSTYSSPLV